MTIRNNRIPAITRELDEAVSEEVMEIANEIVASAKQRVPKDDHDLEESIHVEVKDGEVYVVAGNNKAFYGHIVEGGSSGANPYGAQPPRPFLLPAYEQHRHNAETRLAKALQRMIDRGGRG